MRVLFTGGGGAGSGSLWQQLSSRYDVHFADADPSRIPPEIPSDHRHQLPLARAAGFVSGLSRVLEKARIDVLVPGVDEELLPIAHARDSGGLPDCRVLMPATEDITRCLDKLEFTRRAADAGLRVPRTERLDQRGEWSAFPCIVKPRTGRGSAGVGVMPDRRALDGWSMVVPDAQEVIVQTLISGTEYTVQVVADADGRLSAIVPVRVHSKRGITVSAITEAMPAVIAACRDMHAAFPTAAVVNVQGMLDAEGSFWPFEVNPRVSTTLCLVVAAGVDPIDVFLDSGVSRSAGTVDFITGLSLERFWDTRISSSSDGGSHRG